MSKNDEDDERMRRIWSAAVTDVTDILATLDEAMEKYGDHMIAAGGLAMRLDEQTQSMGLESSRIWLCHRMAVALVMMHTATGPISDKLAQDVVAKLAGLL